MEEESEKVKENSDRKRKRYKERDIKKKCEVRSKNGWVKKESKKKNYCQRNWKEKVWWEKMGRE